MGKLIFIGLGLGDERGITLRGMEAAMACDQVFVETYTSKMAGGSMGRLGEMLDKKLVFLGRDEVEKGEAVLDAAKNHFVCLLVPGDPMSATTHVDLRLRARELQIETEVIGGVSALTSVPAMLGLQTYKFGRTVTIPFQQPNFKPTSFYEMALENFKAGLHTLCLLDIQSAEGKYMTANEGFDVLASVEKELNKDFIKPKLLVCVVARAGEKDCLARAGHFDEMRKRDFGLPLHSIVIPGKLHFLEAKALVELAGAPGEIL